MDILYVSEFVVKLFSMVSMLPNEEGELPMFVKDQYSHSMSSLPTADDVLSPTDEIWPLPKVAQLLNLSLIHI